MSDIEHTGERAPEDPRVVAEEYIRLVNELRAACVESWIALSELLKNFTAMDEAENAKLAARRGRPVIEGEFDRSPLILSPDDPWTPGATIYLSVPKSEFRARNTKGGRNWTLISNSCLVSMYQYWEGHYRPRLAEALGVPEVELKADAFGELRTLRRSIIHNRERALPEVRKCALFPWFKPGDPIRFGIDQVDVITSAVSQAAMGFLQHRRP